MADVNPGGGQKRDWRQEQAGKEIDLAACAALKDGGKTIAWVTILQNQAGDRSVDQGVESTAHGHTQATVVLAKIAAACEKIKSDRAAVTCHSNIKPALLVLHAALAARQRTALLDGPPVEWEQHFAESASIQTIVAHADRFALSTNMAGYELVSMGLDLIGAR